VKGSEEGGRERGKKMGVGEERVGEGNRG